MKDAYSCDRDEAGLDESYQRPVRGLRADLRAPRARRDRGRRRRRDHGRHRRPRVHGPQRRSARTRSSCATAAATPRTSRSPRSASPIREPEDALPMEDVETPGATTIDALATFLGMPRSRTAKAAFFVDRRRPVRRRDRPRRLRRQRDEARQRGQGDRRAPAGHGRGDQGPRDGGRLRLADRGAATRSSSSTSSSRARRTSSPARTASAGT